MVRKEEAFMNEKLRKLKNELYFKNSLLKLAENIIGKDNMYKLKDEAKQIAKPKFRKASSEIKAAIKSK